MQNIIKEDGGSYFNLRDLFKELKSKLLFIIAIVFVCTSVGGVYGSLVLETKYTTTSTMIVNVGESGTLEESQNLAKALKSITEPSNDDIYEQTTLEFINKYHYYEMGREQLKRLIKSSISVTANSMLLNFTMTSSLPEVESILNIFMDRIIKFTETSKCDKNGEKLLDENGEEIPLYPLFIGKVIIVSPATEPVSDANSKTFRCMVVFCVGGAFLSMLTILIKVLLNNTYTDKISFENDYYIDVLATFEDMRLLGQKSSSKDNLDIKGQPSNIVEEDV